MGLIDELKAEATEKKVSIQLSIEKDIESEINKLFYMGKKQKEEVEFVNQMFTRGGEGQERIGLHASAIIVSDDKFCYRQQVLSLLFKQLQGEQIKAPLKRIFEQGNAIHEKYQRLFLRGGWCDVTDLDYTKFLNKYELSYTPDAIAKIPGVFGDEKIVVEIKSVNTFQFTKMKSHPSGKKQCLLYMRLERIKHGIVLCEDKNTQEMKVFYYDYPGDDKCNKEITDVFVERLQDIRACKQDFIENGKMVERHKKCTSYDCKMAKGCPMADACYNRGIGRIRL